VELTDGRTCLDDAAETTQNDKEKEALNPVRSESAASNRVKRHVAMLGNDDVEVTIIFTDQVRIINSQR